jgi:LPXTG-site transpeptidase (sortase) family protein
MHSATFTLSLKKSWFIACAAGITLYSLIIFTAPANTHPIQTQNNTLPIRLKIPEINVDATIKNLGLTKSGAMDTPNNPAFVGWFSEGTRPGDIGTAVIDGHFGWKDTTPAAFDNLHNLKKGDKIYVQDSSGMITTFIVNTLQLYNPEADTSAVFRSHDGKSHLNLITCEGAWDPSQQVYSNRLVVFADKEVM